MKLLLFNDNFVGVFTDSICLSHARKAMLDCYEIQHAPLRMGMRSTLALHFKELDVYENVPYDTNGLLGELAEMARDL